MTMSSKLCNKCKKEQEVSEFSAHKHTLNGLQSWCKSCTSEAGKLWYIKNKKHRLKVGAEWLKNNKEKALLKSREWYWNNKEHRNSLGRLYAKNNRAACASHRAKRRACKLNATPSWSDVDKIKKIYIESRRLSVESGVVYHVDHIVPLQGKNICGLHVAYNLQIITATENLSKGNKYD